VAYDAGLLERALDAAGQLTAGHIRHKNVFGMRGLLFGERMFAAIGEAGMIVKLRRAELAAALERAGVRPFTPDGTAPLGTWVEIADVQVADDPELRDWLAAGLRALRNPD
jgi:TfoX/Sxy family transcriptional regulator of competence genes